MSMQGAWYNIMKIQAIADQLKLKIIAETHKGFQEYCIIQPVSVTPQVTNVFLFGLYGRVSLCINISMCFSVKFYGNKS